MLHWLYHIPHDIRMALLQNSAISCSAVLAALCRCLQWPSALRLEGLEGREGLDAALQSCELADAPGQWRHKTLLGNGKKMKNRWWGG